MGVRERELHNMRDLANILQLVGFGLYALPILWCTALLLWKGEHPDIVVPLRHFRKFGPVLGLSLGACILGALVGIWMDHGEFTFNWSTDHGRLSGAAVITFFAVWVSNIKLEIWTLEPVRKLDHQPPQQPSDMPAFFRAVGSLRTHLMLHSVGLVSVVILSSRW